MVIARRAVIAAVAVLAGCQGSSGDGAGSGRAVGSGSARVADAEGAGEDAEHGRRVGGAAAEPGGHRQPLHDPDREAAVHPEALAEEEGRPGVSLSDGWSGSLGDTLRPKDRE